MTLCVWSFQGLEERSVNRGCHQPLDQDPAVHQDRELDRMARPPEDQHPNPNVQGQVPDRRRRDQGLQKPSLVRRSICIQWMIIILNKH